MFIRQECVLPNASYLKHHSNTKKKCVYGIIIFYLALFIGVPAIALPVIPDDMTIESTEGCKLINPSPTAGETVSWSGSCQNGYAWGYGSVTWYKNNTVIFVKNDAYFEHGFWMTPASENDKMVNGVIRSNFYKEQCYFVLPIWGVDRHREHFEVRYASEDASCPEYTRDNKVRENVEAMISLDGQDIAHYKGTLAHGSLPADGKLTFFTGAEFKFKDQNIDFGPTRNQNSEEKTRLWQELIEFSPGDRFQKSYLPILGGNVKTVSPDLFNTSFKIGSEQGSARIDGERILFANINTVGNNVKLDISYDIKPKSTSRLTASEYKMIAIVKITSIKETPVDMGWLLGGKQNMTRAESWIKKIPVTLTRDTSYRATGKVPLGSYLTFSSALGFKTTTKSITPTVEILRVVDVQSDHDCTIVPCSYGLNSNATETSVNITANGLSDDVRETSREGRNLKYDYDRVVAENYERNRQQYSSTSPAETNPSSSSSSSRTSNNSKPSSNPARGVRNIQSNGQIGGVPSFYVSCQGGGTHIIYKKSGKWYHGSLGHMGGRFDSWSREDVGDHACKNL